jgi:hypothetical protein
MAWLFARLEHDPEVGAAARRIGHADPPAMPHNDFL